MCNKWYWARRKVGREMEISLILHLCVIDYFIFILSPLYPTLFFFISFFFLAFSFSAVGRWQSDWSNTGVGGGCPTRQNLAGVSRPIGNDDDVHLEKSIWFLVTQSFVIIIKSFFSIVKRPPFCLSCVPYRDTTTTTTATAKNSVVCPRLWSATHIWWWWTASIHFFFSLKKKEKGREPDIM